jgi:hypothetical protein
VFGLLGLPALVAGLILRLAGAHWFSGAATVGDVLIAVGGVVIVLSLLLVLVMLIAAARR